jgi:hypothetical protein
MDLNDEVNRQPAYRVNKKLYLHHRSSIHKYTELRTQSSRFFFYLLLNTALNVELISIQDLIVPRNDYLRQAVLIQTNSVYICFKKIKLILL